MSDRTDQDGHRLEHAGMLLGLAVSLLTGQRLGQAPMAMDVSDALEPGKTATSMDKRPAFQEMLERIRTQKTSATSPSTMGVLP